MSKFVVTIDGNRREVELPPSLYDQLRSDISAAQEYPVLHTVLVDGLPVEVVIPELRDPVEAVQCLILDDQPVETAIDPNMRWIKSPWSVHSLEIRDLDTTISPHRNGNGSNDNGKAGNGRIKAPIPGLVIQVRISTGESVEAGQSLFILEAMKMENEIRAPRSGIIKSINVSPGQGVALNQVLAEID